MKYSVIIPTLTTTHEHKEVFYQALSSIVASKPADTEIILVNDGSPIVLGAIELQADKIVRHVNNMGIATSWNDGLRLARGEYVAIVNDDITVQPGWLDKLRMALEDDEANMVAAPGVQGKENGIGIEENYQWFLGYCFMLKWKVLKDPAFSYYIGSNGLFDEQFSPFNYEDTDYWTRVLKAGGKLVRNYNTTITHKEGHVLHTLDYDGVSKVNKEKFVAKWGFDPIPVFYYNAPFPL